MQKVQIAVVSPEAARKERPALLDGLVVVLAWLGNNWSLVADPTQADLLVVLLDGESDEFPLWQHYRARFPSKRMVACGADKFPQEALWRIRWKPAEKAISMPQAFHVLSRLVESLKLLSPSGEIFNPEDYIQGIILDTLSDGVSRICAIAGREQLYLFPLGKTCYVLGDPEALIPLFLARREAIAVSQVGEEELLQKLNLAGFSSRLSRYTALAESLAPSQGAGVRVTKSYSMDEILWLATLVNSLGRCLAACPFDEFNRILRWPEFIEAPFYQDYLPALETQAMSGLRIRDIAERTQASRRQATDLHNAGVALQLMECNALCKQTQECFKLAQEQIYGIFKPISTETAGRIKIIISGPVGSGKSTAIKTLIRCSPMASPSTANAAGNNAKPGGSDNLDHGEIRYKDLFIRMYGTPDQRRYGFIGDILCKNAVGLVLLVSNTLADPIGELDYYLERFKPHLTDLRVAIGVTFYNKESRHSLEEYRRYLSERGLSYVVTPVNVDNPIDMARLLGYLARAIA